MSVFSLQQTDILRILQSGNIKWLVWGINLLLLVWIASLLASLTWSLLTPPADTLLENVEVSPLAVVTDPNAQLISQLPGWHLMGVATRKQAPIIVETPIDAPDTSLKLVLHGLFASEDPARARAIIADPRGKEDQYSVGDKLPGNAELSEVYPDRVILKRNGRYETLRLDPESRSVKSNPRILPARTLSQATQQRIRDVRQNNKGPMSLLEVVRPRPYMAQGNRMIGYALRPGKEQAVFNELGLRAGDIAVAINGVSLDTPDGGMKALQEIKSGETVSLTLLRGGEEKMMNFSMP